MKWINNIFAALFAPTAPSPATQRPPPPPPPLAPRAAERIQLKIGVDRSDLDAALASAADLRAQWVDISTMVAANKSAGAVLIGQAVKLDLAQGDALVLTVPHQVSKEQHAQIAAHVRKSLGNHVPVLILGGGVAISQISTAAIDTASPGQ